MKQYSFEYIFGCIAPKSFTVAKFEIGEGSPLEVYNVDLEKEKGTCACPAWRSGKTRPCKHLKMLGEYIRAGEPAREDYRCVGIGKDWLFSLTREGDKS